MNIKNFLMYPILATSQLFGFSSKNLPKVPIVAIIDTGFDLQHPAFNHNIIDTFDFSKKNKDVGPYIPYDKKIVNTKLSELVKIKPELIKWFAPHRDIKSEYLHSAYHGTAVAALAVYDLPVKAALYKIFPIPSRVDGDEWMSKTVLSAIKRAIKNGAEVINLSIAFTFEVDGPHAKKHFKLRKNFDDMIRKNPNVLFVAASGNENITIDNKKIFAYPCGLERKNIICVSAVDHSLKPWYVSEHKGTNFVKVPSSNVIFSYGESVYTAIPTNMCVTKDAMKFALSDIVPNQELANKLFDQCIANSNFIMGEATSMATPLITHRVLEIKLKKTNIEVNDLIDELMNSARKLDSVENSKYVEPINPSWN